MHSSGHSAGDSPRVVSKVAKALSHPVRVRLLQALNNRVVCARELAEELKLTDSHVRYHLNELLEAECAQLATTRKLRGKDVRFYTAKPGILLSAPHIQTAIERRPATAPALQGFLRRARAAADAGAAEWHDVATFLVESMDLTEKHRETAEEAIHLTMANLRTLSEQSRVLNIATGTPLSRVEFGFAMFPADEGAT